MSERVRLRPVNGDLGIAARALTRYTRLKRAERDGQLAEEGSALWEGFENNFGLAIKHKKALMNAIAAGLGKAGKLYGRKRVTPPPGCRGVSRRAYDDTARQKVSEVASTTTSRGC